MRYERITIEPGKMGGAPCIRGMRMPVVTVVKMVASGMTNEEIIQEHPELEPEDVKQALFYAADAVDQKTLPLVVPT